MLLRRLLSKFHPNKAEKEGMESLEISRTHRMIETILMSGSEIKLEIGSGPVKGRKGWTTLDLTDQADLCWNLLDPLPFPDGSVSAIYSSHLLEHFYYRKLMELLGECFRVLKSGGSFSACVPDASIYLKAYFDIESFNSSFLTYKPAVISEERMDIVNYIAYMDGEHRYMFDQSNLLRVLAATGFVNVRSRHFDPELDMLERKYESIYAVGTKP